MYSISFTKADITFCLSLHYNGGNSYMFVNGQKITNLKQKCLKFFQKNCAKKMFQKIFQQVK